MKLQLNSKNFRLILIALLVLISLGFFAIAFSGVSALNKKSQAMVDLKTKSQDLDSQLSNLEQAKKEVDKYSYFRAVAKTVIPADKNQAEAVLEIYQMASDSGISLQSVTFPASTLGTGTAQNAAGAGSAAAALTQAKPVTGIPGLYSLELTITPASGNGVPADRQVTYAKMLDFFKHIENNRHTAQITEVSIQPASDSQALSFTLVINIFIKP